MDKKERVCNNAGEGILFLVLFKWCKKVFPYSPCRMHSVQIPIFISVACMRLLAINGDGGCRLWQPVEPDSQP